MMGEPRSAEPTRRVADLVEAWKVAERFALGKAENELKIFGAFCASEASVCWNCFGVADITGMKASGIIQNKSPYTRDPQSTLPSSPLMALS